MIPRKLRIWRVYEKKTNEKILGFLKKKLILTGPKFEIQDDNTCAKIRRKTTMAMKV